MFVGDEERRVWRHVLVDFGLRVEESVVVGGGLQVVVLSEV